MNLNYIESFIKVFGLNLCIGYCFVKIIDYTSFKVIRKIVIVSASILLALIGVFLSNILSSTFTSLLIYILYNFIFCILTKYKFGYALIVTILSISISCIIHVISSTIISIFDILFQIHLNTSLFFIILSLINLMLISRFFKIKKFRNGFQFVKNKEKDDYFDTFVLIIGILVICMFIFMGNYSNINRQYLFFTFLLLSVILLMILQKTFTLYHKHKLLEKNIIDYKLQINQKDNQIKHLLNEENKLVKANHEFYHRQQALKYKLINLKETNANFNEEYGEILKRIDNLSEEYKSKIESSHVQHKLPKCEISELDDMFNYMQSECIKNNIEFLLKINGNIHSLINNIIPKSRLETLIGDLIRNSIIALNYSHKEYRSIMVILGIKEDCFEFCIYDSGIEFQIDTLLKLGLEKATTHSDNGGSGIGFITTFETLKMCNASLIINEISPNKNNYTKSITIKFNNKFEYIINSYRFSELSNCCKERKDIIINPFLD